ncbi:MAG: arylsulfatase [Armatimonadota bacterium]
MPTRRPNVILVMTDDQGYGELGCNGNPWIQTPNIDEFYTSATRCENFHVSPLCTPTRGALMSARNPLRNGAWATCWGRSILRRDETTMADVFLHNDYATGMFGKWHIGDNYPYRPQDRGFEHVVAHKGGGVGQTPDYWGNDYFDDTYFHNGEPVPHDGYCTDIWFEEAMSFIEENREEPFFAYVSTNAPHSPYLVADEYADLYRGNEDIPEPEFYGMITNIDENFGKLRRHLQDLEIEDDTILIFMTDNGTSGGWYDNTGQGYNAGMRGRKGSYYDGGHRVPFIVRWPNGNITGGNEINDLVTHMDLLPTFCDLCDLDVPDHKPWDGMSFAPILRGENASMPDREVFLQFRQSTEPPEMWDNGVMCRDWRLIGGKELYYMPADPGQKNDVSEQYPDMVRRLRIAHEEFWAEIEGLLEQPCPISLGADEENPTRLGAMDVLGDVAWNQGHIKAAKESTGRWAVDVEKDGNYTLELQRWPKEIEVAINEALPPEHQEVCPFGGAPEGPGETIDPERARISIAGMDAVANVEPGAERVTFEAHLPAGVTELEAWFIGADGKERGAYYVYVKRE